MYRSCMILCLLPFLFCACAAPPDPTELWMPLTEPFVCALSADTDNGEYHATFRRTGTEDTVTVTGEYGNTVFVCRDGIRYLSVGATADAPATEIPIPASAAPTAEEIRAVFSVFPDSTAAVTVTDGIRILTWGNYTASFSADGTPFSVSDGTMTVRIHTFVNE